MLYLLQFVAAVELSDFLVGVSNQETERIALGYLAQRLAVSSDGIQLTLKVYCHESINIANIIKREAAEAVKALINYQLKH